MDISYPFTYLSERCISFANERYFLVAKLLEFTGIKYSALRGLQWSESFRDRYHCWQLSWHLTCASHCLIYLDTILTTGHYPSCPPMKAITITASGCNCHSLTALQGNSGLNVTGCPAHYLLVSSRPTVAFNFALPMGSNLC